MDSHVDNLPGAVQELENPDRIRHLETQVSQLQQAVTSHAVIDQAIGVIVAVGHMTPDEAWGPLCETSMCTNSRRLKRQNLQ
ncbi:ANTAR domain-containing protein [Streptomyces mirabilis]|uniref:ANTAR domain-containing protein n=1 Tax=Streptomyces mirabilis TaxID=68239 RepID=UPI0033B6FBDB